MKVPMIPLWKRHLRLRYPLVKGHGDNTPSFFCSLASRSQLVCRTACICRFTVDIHMQLRWKIEFFMCESLEATTEVTGDQEKMKIFSTKWTRGITLARYVQTASFLCSATSGFTTLVNKRRLHIISTLVFFTDVHWRVKPFLNVWK